MPVIDRRASATPTTTAFAATARTIESVIGMFNRIPHDLIAVLARFSIAMTFWLSGQTKVEGLVVDPIGLQFHLGWPHLSDTVLVLFRSEYALPLIRPEWAAVMAATAEHIFPVLLLLGLATRVSAFALLLMTLVIEVFVYPEAFPTHGMWAVAMLYLMAKGPGRLSFDHLLSRQFATVDSQIV